MERSSGLICFLFSLEHALPGGSCSWLPWTPSPSCQQTHSLPESITGLRPAHFMLCGCLCEAAHTKKMPAFLWAMSLDVRSKQGNVRSSWERQRVSLQLALLCWGVVLRSRKPFILPPLTPHKSGNTSIHLCIQIPCWGEGWLYMGWRKLVKQNLKPHQLGRAYFLLTISTWAFLRLPFFS